MRGSRQTSVVGRQKEKRTTRAVLLKTDDCRLSTAQSGFTLAGLLVILTILAVVLAYTVPTKWSDVRNRERDRQLMFVMEQYARSIQEYQRRTGALPVSLDNLEEFNSPRVLRQLYVNPLSGEVDWILVPPGAGGGPGAPGQANPGQTEDEKDPFAEEKPKPGQPGEGAASEYVGPFIGVRPPQTGESYLEFNEATRYEEWLFTIEHLQQQQNPGQQPLPGQQPVPQEGNE